MKKSFVNILLTVLTGVMIAVITPVFSCAQEVIPDGVYAMNIPLKGLTSEQAKEAINSYIDEISTRSITLYTVGDEEITVTPADLGFRWANPEIIDDALSIGQTGNIVSRYKKKKDLNYTNKIYDIDFALDEAMVLDVLQNQCSSFDRGAKEGSLTLDDGGNFIINAGEKGMVLDVEASKTKLEDFFMNEWTGDNSSFQLVITVDDPNGSYEDLSMVKDVLGTYSTSFKTSSSSRSANVTNGASLINGSVIYPGEEYSFYDHVKPFTADNGYKIAAAYSSGQVVDSVGGGICQVSSTLYNAVLLSELEVTERRNHGMIVTYVDPARDATIAESAGTDFRFMNNTDAPIYIDAYTTDEKKLYITIYGHETRPADRELSYESEVISRTDPGPDVILQDPSQPIGYVSTQSAHVGYKANLWKIVTQNGETTKELVNTSTYNPAPKYVTVGTATSDPNAAAALDAAIASGNVDSVKSTASTLKNATPEQAQAVATQAALEAQAQALYDQQALEQAQALAAAQAALEMQAGQ